MKKVILKPGKEKSLLQRHPWIFSGAIDSLPSIEEGEILPVHSAAGSFLALAYFHPSNSLAGRVLSFQQEAIAQLLLKRIEEAFILRQSLFDFTQTNAYRLINAEGDGLPGLIVDCYGDLLVLQITTWGMERLKPLLIDLLAKVMRPRTIYEKSLSSSRLKEGLEPSEGVRFGEPLSDVTVLENGVKFCVSVEVGQKTGLFLDQREMRKLIASHANGKRVLNCFSYTGGFSLFALQGGATHVDSVDTCPRAARYAEKNTALNNFSSDQHTILQKDVFEFLRSAPLDYDIAILDPPAFAKKKGDLLAACQGYKEINRLALQKLPPRSLLLTCSCSYFVDEKLFGQLLFQSAEEARRNVKILSRHLQAKDHPVSIYHPEGEYLKSLLLYVE